MKQSCVVFCCLSLSIAGCSQSNEGDANANEAPTLTSLEPEAERDAKGKDAPILMMLSKSRVQPCEYGGVASGDEVGIKGESPVFDAPGGSRVINQKATDALGKTHYQQVDNSERLREICRTKKWSKVRVIEPTYLKHVVGWVPVSALRSIKRNAGGTRQYVEADFTWRKDTLPHKARLLSTINRISRENANCARVDPGTLFKSPTRSRPNKPVFFITCTSQSGDVFNVWF